VWASVEISKSRRSARRAEAAARHLRSEREGEPIARREKAHDRGRDPHLGSEHLHSRVRECHPPAHRRAAGGMTGTEYTPHAALFPPGARMQQGNTQEKRSFELG
jgi:hypothetical protein